MWPSLRTHLLEQMTPRDFRNIHTTGNSCRNAFPCMNMAPKLPWYFYQLMEKPLGDYFQVWSPFMMQIIYCIIHMCLYSCFILFLFLYISFQETGHGKNTNPSLFIQVAKFQQNEWKKKSRGIRLWALNMLLGQLIVLFCSFFLDDFTIWFCSTSKILIC